MKLLCTYMYVNDVSVCRCYLLFVVILQVWSLLLVIEEFMSWRGSKCNFHAHVTAMYEYLYESPLNFGGSKHYIYCLRCIQERLRGLKPTLKPQISSEKGWMKKFYLRIIFVFLKINKFKTPSLPLHISGCATVYSNNSHLIFANIVWSCQVIEKFTKN